jgi:hypothetical protein
LSFAASVKKVHRTAPLEASSAHTQFSADEQKKTVSPAGTAIGIPSAAKAAAGSPRA